MTENCKQINIVEEPNGNIKLYSNGVPVRELNFWVLDDSCRHEFQADTIGHPYCRKCGRYAYSNTYKPICKCEDRNTDYHLTVCCAEKILINKEVAKKWANEMLAQEFSKYAQLNPPSVVDLLNEIRKSL